MYVLHTMSISARETGRSGTLFATMALSSERFEMCHDELEGLLDQLRANLDSLAREVKGVANARSLAASTSARQQHREELERRRAAVARLGGKARDELVEARRTLDDMEQEAKQAPKDFRLASTCNGAIRTCNGC